MKIVTLIRYFCKIKCVSLFIVYFLYINVTLQTMDRFKKALENSNITFSEKRFDTAKGVESLGDNPFVS